MIDCDGGYFAGNSRGGTVLDWKGQKVKEFADSRAPEWPDAAHLANFIASVRSRRMADLHAEAREGHASAACCHLGNTSHRLRAQVTPEAIL